MLSDLIHPPECRKSRNCQRRKMEETGGKGPENDVFGESATVTVATVATDERMPSRPELAAICRRACSGFHVDPDHLLAFLIEAEDPGWTAERVARRLAQKMAEGLIHWRAEK